MQNSINRHTMQEGSIISQFRIYIYYKYLEISRAFLFIKTSQTFKYSFVISLFDIFLKQSEKMYHCCWCFDLWNCTQKQFILEVMMSLWIAVVSFSFCLCWAPNKTMKECISFAWMKGSFTFFFESSARQSVESIPGMHKRFSPFARLHPDRKITSFWKYEMFLSFFCCNN